MSGPRSRRGAYSVMNSAVAIENGTAIISAITAITTVQYDERRDAVRCSRGAAAAIAAS